MFLVFFSPTICKRSLYETDGYQSVYRLYFPNGSELKTQTFSLNDSRSDNDVPDTRSKLYIMGFIPVDSDPTKGALN